MFFSSIHLAEIQQRDAYQIVPVVVNRAIYIGHAREIFFSFIQVPAPKLQKAQDIETHGDLRMHLAEDPFLYRERFLEDARGFVVTALIDERLTHGSHDERAVGVFLAVPGLFDGERLPVILLGFMVVAEIMLHQTEVIEIIRDARMHRAIKLAIHRQTALVQRIRYREMAEIVVRGGKFIDAFGNIGSDFVFRRLQPDGFVQRFDSLVVIAALFEDPSQGGLGLCHGGVLKRQPPPVYREPFLDQALGFGELPLIQSQCTQRH